MSIKISKKQILSIEEFMENYLKKEYDGRLKLTHSEMNNFLMSKGICARRSLCFDSIKKEEILKGEVLFVKDDSGQILAYHNPTSNIESILFELNTAINKKKSEKARKQNLREMGYQEFGEFILSESEIKEYELYDEEVNVKPNRQKQMVKYRARGLIRK